MKTVLGLRAVPRRLSVWNLQEGDLADAGPPELPSVDVGRTLMIGAGAVGAGVVYWLMHWGQHSPWAIVYGDHVELHNTNRCVLFFPDDAGWLGGGARFKSACLAEYLPAVRHIEKWYDEAPETGGEFDTVLVLANERDVRTQVSHRNDPVQFQATTSRNWVAQLHRHIAGVDDCIRCRMLDIRTPNMECSEDATATVEKPQRPDAALPFLSLASGLMLVSKLQHLQLGTPTYCSCDLLARSGLAAGSSPVAIVEFLLRHLWRNSLYEPSANAGRSPPPRKPTADPAGDLHHQRDRKPEQHATARGANTRTLPERLGGAEAAISGAACGAADYTHQLLFSVVGSIILPMAVTASKASRAASAAAAGGAR